jgi:glycosyltransferase involved in cell wall biosynthesis
LKLSIIIPIYNEEENINILNTNLIKVLNGLNYSFEVIYVNDGSSDDSAKRLSRLSGMDNHIKVIHFKRNYGQTAAMMCGIDFATGDIVIPMDGDLQNDPDDIPRLLEKINEGCDVCSGWRKNRKDGKLLRIIPSMVANWLISRISGVSLHDYGCSLKAYRRSVLEDVRLYGEMHRFIPIYASWQGAKVEEIPVKHHARKYGESKYGLNRTFKVVLDLIVIKFLSKYEQKPIHFFGGFGIVNIFVSLFCFFFMLYLKFAYSVSFILTPLPLLSAFFFLIGTQSILLGLLAEMLMRVYYESQDKKIYSIAKIDKEEDD